MSHKAKGLSRTSHWLSSFHWAGSLCFPCPLLLSSVLGPVAACRNTEPLGLKGGALFSFDPVVGIHLRGLLSTRPAHSIGIPLLCAPLNRVTQYRPTTRNITANTSPHCQATGFTSSFYEKFHFKKKKGQKKKKKRIKNQWNSNVRQSTVWTERGRQAFHHQQLPAKQLQTLLWNALKKILSHNTIWWLLGGYMKLVKW